MKKIIFFAILLTTSSFFAQVGIGTTVPEADAILELKSSSKALLLTRVATTGSVSSPVNGMMIYDISSNCFKAFENNAWSGCLTGGSSSTTTVVANCGTGFVGSFVNSTALSGTSYQVTITNNSISTANLTFANTDLTLGGASGNITKGTPTPTSSNLAPGASVTVTYPLTGTPSGLGTLTATWTKVSLNCSASTNIQYAAGAGSFSGKTCFDIAEGNDNTNSCGPLTSRQATKSDFSQTATNTQSYVFTPSGTVSNVRFFYTNTNGTPIASISGNNTGNSISTAVTATVIFNNNLNTTALGTTSANALSAEILVLYNDGLTNNGVDRQLKIYPKVKDCACCVVKVSATVSKEFLCHNLGANTTLDPHDMTQTNAWGLNGAYIAWGMRGPNTTGDSSVDWQTAVNNGASGFAASPTVANANAAAISGWNVGVNPSGSWGATKTVNDPCPSGYRVPTSAEWTGVNSNNTATRTGTFSESSTNYGVALHYGPNSSTKLLTLPAAGYRSNTNGLLISRGLNGLYWSTNVQDSSNRFHLLFFSNNVTPSSGSISTNGMSIRCIAE